MTSGQGRLFNQIKLNIDFTKLAKIAYSKGKKEIADFLIDNEKSIVKKIPYFLEVQQYDKALIDAMGGGDPNIINKVLSEILKKTPIGQAIKMIANANPQDGLRHLRNFAKNRDNDELLTSVAQINRVPDY